MTKEQAVEGYSLFVLPYYIGDGGDGSAYLSICASIQEAEEKDDEQSENGGWGEPSVGELEIYVKDRLLYSLKGEFIYNEKKPKSSKYEYSMVPLTKVR